MPCPRILALGLLLSGPSWEVLHEEAKISDPRALVYTQKTIQGSPCSLPREKQSVLAHGVSSQSVLTHGVTFEHCSCGWAIIAQI